MRHVVSAAFISTALLFGACAHAQVPQGYPADYAKIVEAAKKEGKVVIYSTTDAVAANPLVKDFEALYPGIKVEYSDLNSTELYNRFIAEAAANNGTADVLWSSAMDLQVKLVADGQAATYASPEITVAAEMGGVERCRLRHDLRADRLRLQQAAGAGSRRAEGPHRPVEAAQRQDRFLQGQDHGLRSGTFRRRLSVLSTRTSRISRRPGICSRPWARPGQALHQRRRHDGARHVRRAPDRLRHLRLLRARPLQEGPEPRHRPAEGLHHGHLARRLHLQAREEPERRQAVPRLHLVEARRRRSSPTRPTFIRCVPTSKARQRSSASRSWSATRRARCRSTRRCWKISIRPSGSPSCRSGKQAKKGQ